MNLEELGKELIKLRKKKGLTIEEICVKISISPKEYMKLELGKLKEKESYYRNVLKEIEEVS